MLATVALSAVLVLSAPGVSTCAPAPSGPGDEALRTLYEGGRTFQDFLGGARRRTELWNRLASEGTVSDALVARARAVGGAYRILAVAEDWCGDSAHNLPYIAKLVDAVEGLELRVINSQVGKPVMEAHRTPDGRAATPTFILMDDQWNEVGCFVERPSPLMAWYMENRSDLDTDALHEHILDFYAESEGGATVLDMVEILESAAAGRPRCVVGAG